MIDRKIRQIHRKLKALGTNVLDVSARPKGMHERTYKQYLDELKGLWTERESLLCDSEVIYVQGVTR